MYRIAKIRLSTVDDINEAVQNTVVKAFINIKKLNNSTYFKTWIIRILINECNNIYKFKNETIFEEYNETNISEISKDYINDLIENIDFFELMQNLNLEERTIITLFYSEDLPIKEISKILEIPKSTVTTKLSRARNKLKKICEGGNLYE